MNPPLTNDERSMAVERIILKREQNTLVILIPPTTAEHNMIVALLDRLRHDYPGAWAVAQRMEREQKPVDEEKASYSFPTCKSVPQKAQEVVAGMKEVSREHLGLPPDEPIGDVPL